VSISAPSLLPSSIAPRGDALGTAATLAAPAAPFPAVASSSASRRADAVTRMRRVPAATAAHVLWSLCASWFDSSAHMSSRILCGSVISAGCRAPGCECRLQLRMLSNSGATHTPPARSAQHQLWGPLGRGGQFVASAAEPSQAGSPDDHCDGLDGPRNCALARKWIGGALQGQNGVCLHALTSAACAAACLAPRLQ
jgi:hypothetical protein